MCYLARHTPLCCCCRESLPVRVGELGVVSEPRGGGAFGEVWDGSHLVAVAGQLSRGLMGTCPFVSPCLLTWPLLYWLLQKRYTRYTIQPAIVLGGIRVQSAVCEGRRIVGLEELLPECTQWCGPAPCVMLLWQGNAAESIHQKCALPTCHLSQAMPGGGRGLGLYGELLRTTQPYVLRFAHASAHVWEWW